MEMLMVRCIIVCSLGYLCSENIRIGFQNLPFETSLRLEEFPTKDPVTIISIIGGGDQSHHMGKQRNPLQSHSMYLDHPFLCIAPRTNGIVSSKQLLKRCHGICISCTALKILFPYAGMQ